MTFDGIQMLQIWNPFLETGDKNPDLTTQLELYQQERNKPVPVQDQKSAGPHHAWRRELVCPRVLQ